MLLLSLSLAYFQAKRLWLKELFLITFGQHVRRGPGRQLSYRNVPCPGMTNKLRIWNSQQQRSLKRDVECSGGASQHTGGCSCMWWLQQAGAAASHGLHVAYEDCIGSAAGAVLAILLLSLQMHSLTMHFHNLASSKIMCVLKYRQSRLWNFVPQHILKAKTKDFEGKDWVILCQNNTSATEPLHDLLLKNP